MPDMTRSFRWILFGSCAAGLLLVLAALLYRPLVPQRSMGSGPAGPTVAREPWTRVWSSQPVVLVGLGDSVTAGFGTSPEHSYFNRLISNPSDEFADLQGVCLKSVYPNLKAVNLSISGTISKEHVDEQLPKVQAAGPDTLGLIVLTTGGNDLIHNYGHTPPREGAMYGARLEEARSWIDSFEKRLEGMFQTLRSRFPGGCHIFIADIYDPTDDEGDIEHAGLSAWPEGREVLKAYNDAIRKVAGRIPQVHVVPMRETFLGHGIHCEQQSGKHYRAEDPHYWYFSNLEDPNDRGYDAIRRLFLIEIEKALVPRR